MVATDHVHETPTTVVIFVRDVNDLPPIFDQGSYTASIREEYVARRPLLQVLLSLVCVLLFILYSPLFFFTYPFAIIEYFKGKFNYVYNVDDSFTDKRCH